MPEEESGTFDQEIDLNDDAVGRSHYARFYQMYSKNGPSTLASASLVPIKLNPLTSFKSDKGMLAQLKHKQSPLLLTPLNQACRTLTTVLDYMNKGENTLTYTSEKSE